MGLKALLKKIPGLRLLRGGWPDEARVVIQTPVFRRLIDGHEPHGTCLNAGCGEGLFVSFLDTLQGLTRIVHMDLKKPNLARLKCDSRHEAAEGSLVDLPFAESSFDFVFCTEVLEHIQDDERAFREIARVLRPGGLALLSTPTPPAPYDPAHVREGYGLDQIREEFAANGIRLLRHTYCFHAGMRLVLRTWRWQCALTGQQKSWIPLAVILGLAQCDRGLPMGTPFDIVVLGRKEPI